MNKRLLLLLFSLFSKLVLAQDIQRVEVKGKIIVENNDIEGVTIYNTSSEKGTITDFDGHFKIEVALNDRVEISALQFQKFTVIVDEGIVNEKKMTIYLVEQVNKLPEIVISPYDLSGNIVVDVNRTRTTNLPFKEDEFDPESVPVDLTNDYKSAVYNPFVRGSGGKSDQLGADIKNGLLKPLLKAIFKKKKKTREDQVSSVGSDPKDTLFDLRDMYTNEQLENFLNIPKDKTNAFIVYAENNGLNYSLLREGREVEFLESLVLQSKSFLALQSEKN